MQNASRTLHRLASQGDKRSRQTTKIGAALHASRARPPLCFSSNTHMGSISTRWLRSWETRQQPLRLAARASAPWRRRAIAPLKTPTRRTIRLARSPPSCCCRSMSWAVSAASLCQRNFAPTAYVRQSVRSNDWRRSHRSCPRWQKTPRAYQASESHRSLHSAPLDPPQHQLRSRRLPVAKISGISSTRFHHITSPIAPQKACRACRACRASSWGCRRPHPTGPAARLSTPSK